MEQTKKPLVIDLDGTLLDTDLLLESGLVHLKRSFFGIFQSIAWLLAGGKAHLKEKIAERCTVDVSLLPYNQATLQLIAQEKAKGREIVLATASHKHYAEQIAKHLGVFDRVFATEQETNLSSGKKRDLLLNTFGKGGFDYAGNAHADIPVWQAADKAVVVNPSRGVLARLPKDKIEQVIQNKGSQFLNLLKAMRPHQWLKNLLIFVPLLASHQLSINSIFITGPLAFLFFGLCASSVYLLNDMLDMQDDRQHSTKRHRPFASGQLSLHSGLLMIPLLLIAAFSGAILLLPWKFTLVLASYYTLTLVYTLFLKRKVMVDVITLGALYTLRIVAGAYAFGIALTFWMLAFSMFIFLSLALVKRYSELFEARARGKKGQAQGRGYFPDDLEMIAALGAAAGYLSVMVLALYIQDEATIRLYSQPKIIWLSCPVLLFWVSRVWMLAHRGQMNEDPVVFAIKDKTSLLVGLLFMAIFWCAI